MKLNVATSQFPVSSDLRRNTGFVLRQMRVASERGAHLIHFCEGALSGYVGVDFASFDRFDWGLLTECTQQVLERARELRLWVLLGSSHRLTGRHKPHNSVYVIDDQGAIVDRYDKRFCAGDRSQKTSELAHFSPGDHHSLFTLRGLRCGVLICHEYRYPELYRAYKQQGVQVLFHSFHAGNVTPRRLLSMRAQVGQRFHRLNRGSTLPEITMPASMQAASASSHLWISCANSSARESCWPAFFVRPDGVVTGRLRRNTAGVLISTVDPKQRLYDSTVAWRERATRGQLHSGTLVRDRRSRNRRAL